jgi:hypothetical protein
MPRARDVRVALGLDWGNASPGCVLWGCALADGHVHIFDEYKFQRMTAKDVAWEVKQKCDTWNLESVPYCCCDPSLLPAKKGVAGEWIGLTLQRHGLPVRRVSNDRVNGWQRVHEALAMDPVTKTPWLTVHPRCRYLTRTLPLMVQAKLNPEDLESDSDDHACDALRYLLMGGLRPGVVKRQVSELVPMSSRWWRKYYGDDVSTGVLRT